MLQLHAMANHFLQCTQAGGPHVVTESTALPSDSRDHLQPTTASLIAAVQAHMGRHLCPHLLLWLRADLAKRLPSLLWRLLMVPCRRPR